MCGFAAEFSARRQVSSDSLERAAKALVHRGPDNQSVWVEAHGRAGLAHARLSLLDLSASGDQPLTSVDERLKLVHNGEFYDFERIKRELGAKGHRFRTGSDSEILLPLYEEYGTAALAHLRGEFAFVLWDRDNHEVFAARDRFGIKPLFYALHDGMLYFASEVKALFAMGVPARWDDEMVHQAHATRVMPPHRTLYRGVMQVPPGHFLLASQSTGFCEPVLHPYWDFDYPVAGVATSAGRDLEGDIAELRRRFEESIRLRLRADVPVACYLSGGLDSCSVLGAAAKQSRTPVQAFTLSFVDDPEFDESKIARAMAASCGADYHEIPIRWRDLADNFSQALWNAEQPFFNTHGVAKFLLSKAVRQAGIKAVLTGEGSDEIFGGYVHFRKDMLLLQKGDTAAKLERLTAANAASQALMLAPKTSPSLRSVGKALGFVPSFLEAFGYASDLTGTFLNEEFRAAHAGQDGWRRWLNHVDVPRQLTGRDHLNQSLYLWSRTLLPSYLLTVLGDRMEMAHSVEGRLPFLDHELVEHVVRLPVDYKIQEDLTEKYLLREAAKPFITDEVYRRQKHPFLAPPAAAAPDSALFGYVQDTFRAPSFGANPFYDRKATIKVLDALPGMTREEQSSYDTILTTMLSFVVLGERLGISL